MAVKQRNFRDAIEYFFRHQRFGFDVDAHVPSLSDEVMLKLTCRLCGGAMFACVTGKTLLIARQLADALVEIIHKVETAHTCGLHLGPAGRP